MPKVYLTAEQREEAKNQAVRNEISDALCLVKHKTKMSMEDMGKKTGVSRVVISKLLSGEDVEIKISNMIRILEMAGLSIR